MRFLYFLAFVVLVLYSTQAFAIKHKIEKGDNLYRISLRYGVSIDQLKEINNLNSNRIRIGDILTIHEPDIENAYKVKKGDTLGGIALRSDVSVKDLKVRNNLTSDKLSIGQILYIPGSKPPSSDTNIAKEESSITEKKVVETDITESTAVNPLYGEYKTKQGDTLGLIAVEFDTRVDELKRINNLSSDKLNIGQAIKVPVNKPEKSITKNEDKHLVENKEFVQVKSEEYIVKTGDTLSEIAEKFKLKISELGNLNNLENDNLRVGQKLVLKSQSSVQSTQETKPQQATELTVNVEENVISQAPKEELHTVPHQYFIRSGDNLYDLSRKFGLSISELKKWNNLNKNHLKIGERLIVSFSLAERGTSLSKKNINAKDDEQENVEESAANFPKKYLVQKGDTLGHVAEKFSLTVKDIKIVNNLENDKLIIGQELTIAKASQEQVDKAEVSRSYNDLEDYVVRNGDSLYVISKKFGIPINDLKKINSRDGDKLKVGEKLKVPSSRKVSNAEFYIVKTGDTLGQIAKKYSKTIQEIKNLNNLNSNVIKPGDKLLLVGTAPVEIRQTHYTVMKGDTLGIIASRHNVSLSDLKRENGLSSDTIKPGMKLTIPGVKGSSKYSSSTFKKYKIKNGDTLSQIAQEHGITLGEIKRINGLTSSRIRAGRTINVPGGISPSGDQPRLVDSNKSIRVKEYSSKSGVKSSGNLRQTLIKVAKRYLGAPYKFGGTSTISGIDCSAYVNKVFSSFDVDLPRTAREIFKVGRSVSRSHLNTGDLVFFTTYAKFPSHVGIYIGNDRFIHASSAQKKVAIDNMSKKYYRKRYIGAKRIALNGAFYDELSKDFDGFN